METFKIVLKSKKTRARIGLLNTLHGSVETPVFMPPATKGYLKSLDSNDLKSVGVQIVLVNAYHLFLAPGDHYLKTIGGIHHFMNWNGPILCDSGGFQIWSLNERGNNQLVKIRNNGVEFQSPYDGSKHFIDPQRSIEIQHNLGVDIVMAFDDCSKNSGSKQDIQNSLALTNQWLLKSLEVHQKLNKNKKKLFFGIVQGGKYQDLREDSLKFVTSLDVDGIAFGGETIGYNMKQTNKLLDYLIPLTPENKPRYTMGLGGSVEDIKNAIIRGVDMFDCVSPARLARHGKLYGRNYDIRISQSKYKYDKKSIDSHCQCFTCQNYSRAYLRYLFLQKEPLYLRLATIHNLYFVNSKIQQIKNEIKNE